MPGSKKNYVPVQATRVPVAGPNGLTITPTGAFNSVNDSKKTQDHRAALGTVNQLFNEVMEASANGTIQRVHGSNNNLPATGERVRGMAADVLGHYSKASAFEAVQKEWNALSNKYKDDPQA